jgi:hypothetical protein
VRAGSSWRLRFISESSGGLVPLKCSKEDRESNYLIKVKFSGRRTKFVWPEKSLRSESGGQNSPRRTHEVARTVGSRGVAGWIRVGRTHYVGFKIQRRPLIMTVEPSRSFRQIGVCKSGVQAKSLGHSNFQIVKWIIVCEEEA